MWHMQMSFFTFCFFMRIFSSYSLTCLKYICFLTNYYFKLPVEEIWVPFLELLQWLVVWVFADSAFSCHKPSCCTFNFRCICHFDYIPSGVCASFSILQCTMIWTISLFFFHVFNWGKSRITTDLPLPGEGASSLMYGLDVIRPWAKWELRHNLASSLKLLL